MIVKTTNNSRGVRVGNFVQIRDAIDEELEAALAGKKTAKQAARRRRQARQRDDRQVQEGQQGLVRRPAAFATTRIEVVRRRAIRRALVFAHATVT